MSAASDPLLGFSAATRAWFTATFGSPTDAQRGAWSTIRAGGHALVVAPTGSGKTLAAFLWALDRLAAEPPPDDRLARCRVVYVSPLKALAVDVERNLRAPLAGIRREATRRGEPVPDVSVAVRTGDTPAHARRRFATRPSDILITTPESLFLLLTSRARDALRGVQTVIVDEVHAVAATKRGAHLALSLERLDALLDVPAQRVGLSATVRPAGEVARFLGGTSPVDVVSSRASKVLDVSVQATLPDMAALGEEALAESDDPGQRSSIWPSIERRLFELIRAHTSTIVFANSRRVAERLCTRLNELASGEAAQPSVAEPARYPAVNPGQSGLGRPPDAASGTVVARPHHGSMSREQRLEVESALEAGQLPCVVATSSLELGIDMGAVDLVVQVAAPPSVASGVQRIGRAGHQVGEASRGVVLPSHRGELLACAVTAERMRAGAIEGLSVPRHPLDVLAQQVVAMVAMQPWSVDELANVVRRAAPYRQLPDSALHGVLDMLAGRYASDAFAALRPRLVWDRTSDTLTARPGAQRLAVVSGGTIPDRGLFGVYLFAGSDDGGPGRRVGELDEEMVYESRVGDVILLGSSTWRIEEITADQVLVSPAPGRAGRLPFWHGDAAGRPAELGAALGAFTRELARLDDEAARTRLADAGLDEWAAQNLLAHLEEQRAVTGVVPDDRTLVVERFRDEIGDWRMVVHSPYGARVHGPWALAIAARVRARFALDAQVLHSDDGIVLRLPDADAAPDPELVRFDPDDVADLVRDEVGGSALFASRFRECAARALLLTRADPRRRMPLWQQRQRSAQLLAAATAHPDFPILLETMRECLQDVFDVAGLVELTRDISTGRVQLLAVETPAASPFARSLLFGYVAAFMYEGDLPLAERRAQALSLDTRLLAELLGSAELRDLLDETAIAEVAAQLQRTSPDRQVHDVEGTADLLRLVGDLTVAEAAARGARRDWLATLAAAGRALVVDLAGEQRWIAIEDAARFRDALAVRLPDGLPSAFAEPVTDPLGDLLARYARTHGPFSVEEPAARYGLPVVVVGSVLDRLAQTGTLVAGEFRPGGSGPEWCDAEVLRMVRRRSLAKLRREVEPVPARTLGRFLPEWQGVGPLGPGSADTATATSGGSDAVYAAVQQLAGAPLPAAGLDAFVLPARVPGYTPGMLDELCAAGEVAWAGTGTSGDGSGTSWLRLVPAAEAPLLLPPPDPTLAMRPAHEAILQVLDGGAAMFFRPLATAVTEMPGTVSDRELVDALWELVWAGYLTNDTLAPLRARLSRLPPARAPARALARRAGRPGRFGPTRYARPMLPAHSGPPTPAEAAGRWWRLPTPETDPNRRLPALTDALLARHGVLTRAAVAAEDVPGGFAAVYPVLRAYEDAGRVRRGYFLEGLGAAQFALPGAVDALRAAGSRSATGDSGHADPLVLAAADPANPYGAALPWPERVTADPDSPARGHRPSRQAGALVVLNDGDCLAYLERGGRSLLTWPAEPYAVARALAALVSAVRAGGLAPLLVERVDGLPAMQVVDSPLAGALEQAGFRLTPRGFRLRP